MIIVAATVLLPLLVLDAWNTHGRYEDDISRELQASHELSQAISAAFASYLDSLWTAESAWGMTLALTDPPMPPELAEALLAAQATALPCLDTLAWVDPAGIVVASTRPGGRGLSLADRDYYQRIARGEDKVISDLLASEVDGHPAFVAARAVRSGGRLLGMVVGSVTVSELGAVLSVERSGARSFGLADTKGNIVYLSLDPDLPMDQRRVSPDEPLWGALRGQVVLSRKHKSWLTGEPVIGSAVPMPGIGWAAFANSPLTLVRSVARTYAGHFLRALALLGMSLLGAIVAARSLVRSVLALKQAALAISEGNLEVRVGFTGNDELAATGQAFDRMASRIQEAEEALRESNKTLVGVIQNSPLPIAAFDSAGNVTIWNKAAERAFGWSESEVLGRRVPNVPPDQREGFLNLHRRVLKGEGFTQYVFRGQRRDGVPVDIRVSAAPWPGGAGRAGGTIAIYDDVTERTRFLQVAAHELRNPMTGAKGILALLRRRVDAGRPVGDLAGMMEVLEGEINRLSALLDDILEAFRLQEGRLAYHFERVDLVALVAETLRSFQAVEETHALVTSGLADGPAWVWGDAGRLEEVVRNLLSNAVKYSPAGGEVRVAVSTRGRRALLTVSDSGLGVPPDQLEHIFEPFFRGSNLAGRDPGGLGLGLYICREVVKRHAGRIWAASKEGTGTTFCVEIPLALRRKSASREAEQWPAC